MILSRILGNAGTVEADKLRSEFDELIVEEESIQIGFRVIRDTFIFTNKRLIIVDVQGMTGRKREYLSIPYDKITMYSIETVGHLDLDAELKIWISSHPVPLEKKFNSKVNIYDVQKVLAANLLK